jgi:hypothetical protein
MPFLPVLQPDLGPILTAHENSRSVLDCGGPPPLSSTQPLRTLERAPEDRRTPGRFARWEGFFKEPKLAR